MTTGKDIITEALKYLGKDGKKFCKDAGIPWGSHWCCAYVYDIFKYKNASKLFCDGKTVVYVPTAQQWLKANCKKMTMSGAKAGDIVVFTWSGNGYNQEKGSRDHIGFIEKAPDKDKKGNVTYLNTVEGNTGGANPKVTKVMRRKRAPKYIYGIYRPNYDTYVTVSFKPRGGTGSMAPIKVKKGSTITLPANVYTRAGFKFLGWSIGKSDYTNMEHFQLGKVKYKNKAKIKVEKDIVLYPCWKGYSIEAAAIWIRKIARDNSFSYGTGERAHHNGCYFCGTNITGPKKAKKGSKWEKTYCCNPLCMAALTHGANLFKKCKNSGLTKKYWTETLKKDGKPLYKSIGKNVEYSKLKVGDLLLKDKKHIKMFSKIKDGKYYITEAVSKPGFGKTSIRTKEVKGRIGSDYIALRYIGR